MKIKKYQNGGSNPGGPTTPEVQANPSLAPSNLSTSMQLYGFEEGPVTMRPDLLLDLLGAGELARAGYSVLKNPKGTVDAVSGALRFLVDKVKGRPATSAFKVFPKEVISEGTELLGGPDRNFLQQQQFLKGLVDELGDLTSYGLSDQRIRDIMSSVTKSTSKELDQITKVRKGMLDRDYLDSYENAEIFRKFQDKLIEEIGEGRTQALMDDLKNILGLDKSTSMDDIIEIFYPKPGGGRTTLQEKIAKEALNPNSNRLISARASDPLLPAPFSMNKYGGRI